MGAPCPPFLVDRTHARDDVFAGRIVVSFALEALCIAAIFFLDAANWEA
jgi:hypothetical protein